jgi:hypothetical protein
VGGISGPEDVDRCHRTRTVLRTCKDLVRNVLDIRRMRPSPPDGVQSNSASAWCRVQTFDGTQRQSRPLDCRPATRALSGAARTKRWGESSARSLSTSPMHSSTRPVHAARPAALSSSSPPGSFMPSPAALGGLTVASRPYSPQRRRTGWWSPGFMTAAMRTRTLSATCPPRVMGRPSTLMSPTT